MLNHISLGGGTQNTIQTGALNKAGHGMHMIPGAFQDYATSERVKVLFLNLLFVFIPEFELSLYCLWLSDICLHFGV